MSERSCTDNDRAVAARVRERRLAIGMSQERLAEILGVTFQQVQKYEKGVNRIAASRLWEISRALDIPVGWLFGACSDAPLQEIQTPEAVSAESVELQRLVHAIKSPVVRKRVVGLVRAVVEDAAP